MSMWGQFLDRYWDLRPGPASLFLHRLGTVRTPEALVESFPLPVLAPRCPIDHFYAFYGVARRPP